MCNEVYNPYAMFGQSQQLPITNQSVPVSSASLQNAPLSAGGVDQTYNRQICLMNERASLDVQCHMMKVGIDEEHLAQMLKFRSDIQIKKELLTNKIVVTEEGGIIRKQEYLLEKPKEYSFTNFRILGRPIKYINEEKNAAVLHLTALIQNQKTVNLYLDLEKGSKGYFWKKFLSAGIIFQKRRDENRDFIFDVLQPISEIAEVVVLPQHRGFYRGADRALHYAGKRDLTWKDVVKYAK